MAADDLSYPAPKNSNPLSMSIWAFELHVQVTHILFIGTMQETYTTLGGGVN